VKPYKVNDQTVDQAFELKHGKSAKIFNMDKVSNAPFVDVRRIPRAELEHAFDVLHRKSLIGWLKFVQLRV